MAKLSKKHANFARGMGRAMRARRPGNFKKYWKSKYKKGRRSKRRTSRRKRGGVSKKPFLRVRGGRYNKASKQSASQYTKKREFGGKVAAAAYGTDTSGQIFVGHTLSSNDLWDAIFVSMVKKLMANCGIYYSSPEDPLIDNVVTTAPLYQVALSWRYGETGYEDKFTTYSIDGPGFTLKSVGEGLNATFQPLYRALVNASSNGSIQKPVFGKLALYRSETAGTRGSFVGSIDVSRMVVSIFHTSTIKLQNRTKTDGSAPTDSTDTLNVNPVRCRVYKGKLNRNYIRTFPKYNSDNAAYVGWTTDASANTPGLIVDKGYYHYGTNFLELPGKKDVDCKSMKEFILHPGQVLQDKLVYKIKIGIDKLMARTFTGFSADVHEMIDLGVAHVVGMDKLIFSRDATNAAVTAGYEVVSSLSTSVSLRKCGTVATIVQDTTAHDF